jgi:hypothetical protein
MRDALSDERTGLSFTILLVLASAVIFESEPRRTRDHILVSPVRNFPFRRLLRLAGLRWRYSTPPPRGSIRRVSYIAFRYPLLITRLIGHCLLIPLTWKLLVDMGMSLLIFVAAETGANEPFPTNGYTRYIINVTVVLRNLVHISKHVTQLLKSTYKNTLVTSPIDIYVYEFCK